jgi:hypothetical protein
MQPLVGYKPQCTLTNDAPRGRSNGFALIAGWALAALLLAVPPQARSQSLPNTVSPPKGINLGSTSFFDGFGRTAEGRTWLQYGRFEDLTRITNAQANNNPHFKGTDIHVYVSQTQLSYTSDWHPFGGDGVSALLPIADFSSHFDQNSPVKLSNNGFGVGDLCIGPFYQSRYVIVDGRPVFAWRAQLSVIAPTGSVNEQRNINHGSGFWAINPFVALTWVPLPKVELSSRVNYQYNFQTSTIESPPPVPGLVYRNGQAGQIIYGNVAMSYAVLPNAYIGVNSYALGQLTPNLTNGETVSHARETEFSAGPGGRYVFDESNALNVDLYLPVVSRNATSGTQFNLPFIHRF